MTRAVRAPAGIAPRSNGWGGVAPTRVGSMTTEWDGSDAHRGSAPVARPRPTSELMFGTVVHEMPEGQPSEILHSIATLAAMVGHEINNPLMTTVANLELLARTQTLDAYGRARLEAALAAAAQIKETIRRLGRITRLELAAGGPNLPPMLDLEKSSREANGEC